MSIAKDTQNPLLQTLLRVMPPTKMRLPSKGLLYKNGELDDEVVDGEIIVYPMTTLDEIIIRNPDMLLQGTAIEQVVGRCAPQIRKPMELFSKDIDYILVFLRKVSYGNDLILKYTCPLCIAEAEKDVDIEAHEYNISVDFFLKSSKELSENYNDTYKIKLTSGQVIHLRPSKYNEMLKMFELNEQTTNPEELREIVNISILSVIKDVDGIAEKELINEWLKELPIAHMREIVAKIADANNFGPEFKYTIKCIDCERDQDISYILNPTSFFTLPSSPTINNV